MRAFVSGGSVVVVVPTADVAAFKARWPCSGLPDGTPLIFEFDRGNGDLLDITPDSATFDGPDLLALSHDAQAAARGLFYTPPG